MRLAVDCQDARFVQHRKLDLNGPTLTITERAAEGARGREG